MIHIIVAMSQNRVIGKDNKLPWRIPEDLKRFRSLTMGNQVVMGRKTFESIGKPLEGRVNVIVSKMIGYNPSPDCIIATSIHAALCFRASEDVFIIGGAEIYQQTIDYADMLHLTLVHHRFKGDTYFPKIDLKKWELLEQLDRNPSSDSRYKYSFLTYRRKKNIRPLTT